MSKTLERKVEALEQRSSSPAMEQPVGTINGKAVCVEEAVKLLIQVSREAQQN